METTREKSQPSVRGISVAQPIAFSLVLGLVAFFAIGIQIRGAQPVERGAAPQFTIPLYGGGTFSLAEMRGKVVVVNFWASWCQPCRDEAPILERVWRRYQDRGVVFVGVDYVDTEPEARAYIKEFDLTYPNGPDIGVEIARQYHIQAVPETYFVGRDGLLNGNHIGPIDERTLIARIEEMLKSGE